MPLSNSGVLGFGSAVRQDTPMGDWYAALLLALYAIYLLLKRQLDLVLLPIHTFVISAIVHGTLMDMVISVSISGDLVQTRKLAPQLRLTKILQPKWKATRSLLKLVFDGLNYCVSRISTPLALSLLM